MTQGASSHPLLQEQLVVWVDAKGYFQERQNQVPAPHHAPTHS